MTSRRTLLVIRQSPMPVPADLVSVLDAAIERRRPLIERLEASGTDCYRLLHGTQEGTPGVTLDRYGDLALLQSFHTRVTDAAVASVDAHLSVAHPGLALVYNDRTAPGSRVTNTVSGPMATAAAADWTAREHDVRYRIKARHRGHDPWLFLDLRTTRRAVMDDAPGRSVLNLCAYTCGLGVAAAVAGATRVLNIDFAASGLAVGRLNADLNAVADRTTVLQSDLFPALRQLAGGRQPTLNRGRRLPPFPRIEAQRFDLVVLDPPPLARSRFGVIDLVRDYQSVLKPALAVVADGGLLYCTNNVARVDETDWHEVLRRCADKHGRPITALDVVRPDEDFPSRDGQPPLKVARLQL